MSRDGSMTEMVRKHLDEFLGAARAALGGDLLAAVLYGSAAEGRIRPASDVNLILVLKRFDRTLADGLREACSLAHAAVRLEIMFLLEAEVPAAMEAFPVKFADVLVRRQVIFGRDPFEGRCIPPALLARHARQVLLNLRLRLRASYALAGAREEQLAAVVAGVAGPLRSGAAALCCLEGRPAASPRESLRRLASGLPGGPWDEALAGISEARERESLPPGAGPRLVFRLMELAEALQARAEEFLARENLR
ncbi:MAG TPA: nucleotidyltransferase domain-containing protein [Planctomycetota bacterium]|nr:nucleotidyltransferase domain-containing protein [Planctomycetota bacterium]